MNIFENDSVEKTEKTDFEKIGVSTIRPFKENGRWLFQQNGQNYDMAPAELTNAVLSPIIVGVDRLINLGCSLKNIQNPENGFVLLFSNEYFPNCDVKLSFKEIKYNGWIYDITTENLKGIMEGQAAWICPYMSMYYSEPPKTIYIKLEAEHGL